MEQKDGNKQKIKAVLLKMEWSEMFNELQNEQVGKLIKNCFLHLNDQELLEMDQFESVLFKFTIKPVLEFNSAKYHEKCERNKSAGLKGGRPSKTITQNNPDGFSNNPEKPKDKDRVIDKVKDIDSNKEINKIIETSINFRSEIESKFKMLLNIPSAQLDDLDSKFVYNVRLLESAIGWQKMFKILLEANDSVYENMLLSIENKYIVELLQSVRSQYSIYLDKVVNKYPQR